MSIKEDHAYHIQNLMDSEPEAQVVELHVAERLEEQNAALVKELEAVKANMGILEIYHKNINQIKADAIRGAIKDLEHDCNGWAKDSQGNVYWHDKQILRVADEIEASSLINNKEG